MTTTDPGDGEVGSGEMIDPVSEEIIDQRQLAERLLAQAREQGVDLVGPDGLLNRLTKNVLETALEAEMDEHLGYGRRALRRGLRAKVSQDTISKITDKVIDLNPCGTDPSISGTLVRTAAFRRS
ncbi:hypothetical protein FB471_1425 [Amycolatopsis cihanbeyliensis]|uniref:Mutator family transposase n=1 Tax=Amycolatopsis cihanbeyliensis TaxID=1128664 RepID=A0A542DF83_AMYCI|nr:hypothetical protein FB471_1425 [Amycolatopsis cihanbeyliensis]